VKATLKVRVERLERQRDEIFVRMCNEEQKRAFVENNLNALRESEARIAQNLFTRLRWLFLGR